MGFHLGLFEGRAKPLEGVPLVPLLLAELLEPVKNAEVSLCR